MQEQDVRTEYEAATAAERAAWDRVRDKHPGTLEHDPALWKSWTDAEKRLVALKLKLEKENQH
jgi:broad specificity phosphatase PhoE